MIWRVVWSATAWVQMCCECVQDTEERGEKGARIEEERVEIMGAVCLAYLWSRG